MSKRNPITVQLPEFVKGKTQKAVAAMLGVTPGAISQAIIAARDVRIIIDSKGRVLDAIEVVKFGRGRREKQDSAATSASTEGASDGRARH